jgi:hypothetical protein
VSPSGAAALNGAEHQTSTSDAAIVDTAMPGTPFIVMIPPIRP